MSEIEIIAATGSVQTVGIASSPVSPRWMSTRAWLRLCRCRRWGSACTRTRWRWRDSGSARAAGVAGKVTDGTPEVPMVIPGL